MIPASMVDQFAATFREEAAEMLAELETTLLGLEEQPDDAELVARVFRALHTLKGSGAMFGFTEIASFAHALESAFDEVRQGKLAASHALVSLALGGKDQIRTLLDGDVESGAVARGEIVASLRELVAGVGTAPATPALSSAPKSASLRRFHVSFRPAPTLLQDGTNPVGLWSELCAMGTGRVVADTSGIPELDALDPESCYVSWDAFLTSDQEEAAVRSVFMFVEDSGELHIEAMELGAPPPPPPAAPERFEAPTHADFLRMALRPQQMVSAIDDRATVATPRAASPTIAPMLSMPPEGAYAHLAAPESMRPRASIAPGEVKSSVRVATEKLDVLVDLVGELVIAQARLSQIAASREDAEIVAIAEDVERLTADLRDNTLNLRMVPIGSTFSRFKRLVRDLSGELGKQIELHTEGAETELDKTVIERLGDAMVHIIRNSCDHGIESPEVRVSRGKPPAGTVRLAAYQSGPNVIIEIQDDGAGMNPVAIRDRAVSRGLIDAEARLTDQELFQLVFLPGFSTAAVVSAVSGRGVGMDVVKRSVESLRGAIEIVSAVGKGSTMRIKLPLTLAIIDGLLVSVGAGRYVLPMSLVEECVEITREQVEAAHGSHLVPVRGELVPYVRLREWFAEGGPRPAIEQIAIASAEGMRFGFAVDDVIGQHQTVIKTLGRMYGDAEGLSGATILGDGTVALIVDVAGVVRTVTAGAPAAA